MWATETNGSGKKYDPCRFRFHVEVFGSLDDPTANVLRRMKQGTVIVYKTLQEAIEVQSAFMVEARLVANGGELAVYGYTLIVDTRDGCIHNPMEIVEQKDKTPVS
jgi:hypothetical protein